MRFINEVILLRCLLGFFFFWSVLCLYVAFRHPDLPKRIAEHVAGASLGNDVKITQTYTNWWVLWFWVILSLALWIAFELKLKDFVA